MPSARIAQQAALTYRCPACTQPIPLPNPAQDRASTCPACGQTSPLEDGILLVSGGVDARDEEQPGEDHDLLVQAEARHFWFDARNRLILATLRDTLGPLAGRTVLDVGCGTGFMLAALERAGMRVCGLDMQLGDLRYARERLRGPLLHSSAHRLPFDAQFDIVLLCDVIEHVTDDRSVLREASRALVDGGKLLVTVPAHPWLWTSIDEVAAHKRRYTRASLTAALAKVGLRPWRLNHFNSLLLPAQVLQRITLRNRSVQTPEEWAAVARASVQIPPGPVNAALWLVAMVDIALRRVPMPLGSSIVAVAERA